MVTFHPSCAPVRSGGFKPAVIIRNDKGQCVGSRVSAAIVFPDKDAARNFAREKARVVASQFPFVRVQ
jgi:hypothetical protein